jgi:hypothetical protein
VPVRGVLAQADVDAEQQGGEEARKQLEAEDDGGVGGIGGGASGVLTASSARGAQTGGDNDTSFLDTICRTSTPLRHQ